MARIDLRIEPRACRWLAERGDELTLRFAPRHGCRGGMARVPVAEPGPPEA